MNKVIKKYIDEINQVKNILFDSLGKESVAGIYIYGSAATEELFDEKYSDIDMIVFFKKFNYEIAMSVVEHMNSQGLLFVEKYPHYIADSLCERVEFCMVINEMNFDITVCCGLIPQEEILIRNVCYDSFEALMGGVYKDSYHLYGEAPDWNVFCEKYVPYYTEDIRILRLENLKKRIDRYCTRIRNMLSMGNVSAWDHIYKLRKLLVKYIFIREKMYFHTPEKNIYYQLCHTSVKNDDIKTLCFMQDGDYKSMTEEFLNVVDSLLKEG